MSDFILEDGTLTDNFREALPDRLGDAYFNDPERTQPTKELDNVKNIFDMAKMVVTGSRKISQHGEALKKATEGMIKIPGEGATPEEIVAYRKAQGVPETPDGYTLTVPDGNGFKEIADMVRAAAHEAGISPSKLSPVWDKVTSALVAQNKALEEQGMKLIAADVQALKDAKKEKYDAFIQDTNKVAAHFDVKADPQIGTEANPIGSNFMKLMENMQIKDTPVVREFLGAIAPLVLEGKTTVGAGTVNDPNPGGFTYEYDANGRPIE